MIKRGTVQLQISSSFHFFTIVYAACMVHACQSCACRVVLFSPYLITLIGKGCSVVLNEIKVNVSSHLCYKQENHIFMPVFFYTLLSGIKLYAKLQNIWSNFQFTVCVLCGNSLHWFSAIEHPATTHVEPAFTGCCYIVAGYVWILYTRTSREIWKWIISRTYLYCKNTCWQYPKAQLVFNTLS